MAQSITSNSSTFQPVIDFTSWCKAETSNLYAPLPAKNKWADIAKRVVILSTLILPLIGILAMMFSGCCTTAPARARPTQSAAQRQQAAAERAQARASAPREQGRGVEGEQPPMKIQELQDSEAILASLEEIGQNEEQLNTYLELRGKIERINPERLARHKTLYDRIVLKINELDPKANFFLESHGRPALPPFAANPPAAPQAEVPLRKAPPAASAALTEKIGTANAMIESVHTATKNGTEFDLKTYKSEKAKFNQIKQANVPADLVESYDQVATMIREIDGYIQIMHLDVAAPERNPPPPRPPEQRPIGVPRVAAQRRRLPAGTTVTAASVNALKPLKTKCKNAMPHFNALIDRYQAGAKIPRADYEQEYVAIMTDELGYTEDKVFRIAPADNSKVMNEIDTNDLLNKIREKLGMESQILVPPFDKIPENAVPFAYLIRGEGHNSVAIRQTTGKYLVIPECPAEGIVTPARLINKEELKDSDTPIYATNVPVDNGYFGGQLPNLNSCAMESCLFLLAAILPPERGARRTQLK